MGRIIAATAERGGSVVIPAFAVDRTEVILAGLKRLTDAGDIPRIPVYLDSPMARKALGLYVRAVEEGDPEIKPEVRGSPEIFNPGDLRITESVDESKAINHVEPPVISPGPVSNGAVLKSTGRDTSPKELAKTGGFTRKVAPPTQRTPSPNGSWTWFWP